MDILVYSVLLLCRAYNSVLGRTNNRFSCYILFYNI